MVEGRMAQFNGDRIREARERMDWSRPDLIRELFLKSMKVSISTISNWEAGLSVPGADDLAVLALVLKKPIPFFYSPETEVKRFTKY